MKQDSSSHDTSQQIIIVRRSSANDDDEHHGGVWKIAYADFMTAMMAFFLVMWLINAANDEAKEAVATYFNPIKLVDEQSHARGLRENQSTGDSHNRVDGDGNVYSSDMTQGHDVSELGRQAQMMSNPYKAIDKIAHDYSPNASDKDGNSGAIEGGGNADAHNRTAYNDPFSPDYWRKHSSPDMFSKTKGTAALAESASSDSMALPTLSTDPTADKATSIVESATLAQEAADIRAQLQALLEKDTANSTPMIEVVDVSDGIKIILSDKKNFGMFGVGAAAPNKETIAFLGSVARILKQHIGDVVISGHTDSRPYHTESYDNWQLSTARAQMAYYMLVRGGLDEKRVLRVEGYADRLLKNTTDSYAAENRRIEIFLRRQQKESAPAAKKGDGA